MIRRRNVLALLAGTAGTVLAPRAMFAQPQTNLPRVAVVGFASVEQLLAAGLTRQPIVPTAELPNEDLRTWRLFFEELDRLGWAEGETFIVDRWSYGAIIADFEARARLIAAVRDSAPAVIVTAGETFAAQLAELITTMPIVVSVTDPVDLGLVTNMARPERNVTGTASAPGGLAAFEAKRIQLLTQIVPTVRQVAWVGPERVYGPAQPAAAGNAEVVATLGAQGVDVVIIVSDPPSLAPADIEAWQRQLVSQIVEAGFDGVYFRGWPEFYFGELNRFDFWPGLLLEARLPSITSVVNFVRASPGALAHYSTNVSHLWPIMAQQVDRILRGAPIADVPFQMTVDSTFRINLRTARALGLTIPAGMLALATEIIE